MISLPSRLACIDKETCCDIDESKCIKISHRVVCLSGFYNEPNACIRSLSNNITDNCLLKLANDKMEPVIW